MTNSRNFIVSQIEPTFAAPRNCAARNRSPATGATTISNTDEVSPFFPAAAFGSYQRARRAIFRSHTARVLIVDEARRLRNKRGRESILLAENGLSHSAIGKIYRLDSDRYDNIDRV